MFYPEETIMKTLNISLTTELRAYIDRQVAKGGYGTASEYIRDLIRQDLIRQAEEELDAKLLEGLNSEEVEVNEEFWRTVRGEVPREAAKAGKKTKPGKIAKTGKLAA
jgi:antitoxin ParD1/3/4